MMLSAITRPKTISAALLWTPQMIDPAKPSVTPAHMKERARELRKNSTIPERILWGLLRDRRLACLKFRHQHCIGPYIVDFYCASRRLVVELDGYSHDDRGDYDRRRQDYLESVAGLLVIRVGNDDVLNDPESVILSIPQGTRNSDHLSKRMSDRWCGSNRLARNTRPRNEPPEFSRRNLLIFLELRHVDAAVRRKGGSFQNARI